jgi:hypothetical protein
MALMIFVNALSSVSGLPWWTYHAPGDVNVMTYVDMVFPFFLFIVGISLPLSVSQRLKCNPSISALWLHVLLRVGGLVTLGLILANARQVDPARTGMSGSLWALLGLLCGALYLNVYPKSERYPRYSIFFRGAGLVGLIVLYALFRPTGHAGWIDGSYPEILGLIGYSFLAVAILYIPTRRWGWAPYVWFVFLITLCALSTAKLIPIPNHLRLYVWPFDNGAMAAMIMAGIITASIFLGKEGRHSPWRAMLQAVGFGLLALVGGAALHTAWHLEDSGYSYLDPLQHRSERSCVYGSLLDLRCEEVDAVGTVRAAGRVEYAIDLSASGHMVFLLCGNRSDVSGYASELRLAGRGEDLGLHGAHAGSLGGTDESQSPLAAVGQLASRLDCSMDAVMTWYYRTRASPCGSAWRDVHQRAGELPLL